MRFTEFGDPILDLIKEKEQLHELSYGNCGILAIALDQKFDMDQFILVTNPAEPDRLYHVAAVKDGKIYDADGITSLAEVKARGFDDDYPEEDPEVESVQANESEYRYILKGTEPDIEVSNLLEHEMVFSRSGSKLKTKWRCTSGTRRGRVVSNAKDCDAPIDQKKRAQMKVTRKTKSKQAARKAKKTKRVNPASKLLGMLNKIRKQSVSSGGKVQKAYKPPKTSLKGTVGTRKTVKPRK